jgi:hypothetical protein
MTGSAQQSSSDEQRLDCFVAEFIIGPAKGRTRWLLAMTDSLVLAAVGHDISSGRGFFHPRSVVAADSR